MTDPRLTEQNVRCLAGDHVEVTTVRGLSLCEFCRALFVAR